MFAAEVVLAVTGFPSVARAAISAVRKDAALHRWSDFEVPSEPAVTGRVESEFGPRPRAGASASPLWKQPAATRPPKDAVKRPPGHFLKVSLAGNTARFVFGPLAWMPTGAEDRSSLDWLLPGMWLWYAALPLAAAGFILGIARHPAFRPIALVTLALGVALAVAGEGTFFRQREMLVPVVLLAGAIGLESGLRHPRLLALMAVAWVLVLGTGIAFHLHLSRAVPSASVGASSQ